MELAWPYTHYYGVKVLYGIEKPYVRRKTNPSNMNYGYRLRTIATKLATSGPATAIPLFIYLFLSSVYFLAVVRMADGPGSHPLYWLSTDIESDAAKYAAELLKQKFQFAAYGFSLLLIVFQLRGFVKFLLHEGTLLVIFFVLLLTTSVSDNPDRVVTNLMHLVFGVLAIWLYYTGETRRQRPVRSAASIVLYSLIFVQLMSVVWFFAHPDGTVDAILSGRRQGGLAGNPNTFGAVCVVFAWAVLTLIFAQRKHSIKSLLWLLPIAIVGFNTWSTGSATTMTDVVVVILLFILHRIYITLDRKKQAFLIMFVAIAFFCFLFWLVTQQNLFQLATEATGSVGKDLTFTGRIDLWALALEAIAERPILGWSYDNHLTVKDNPLYSLRYNHFHNGFLDVLVVGGALLGVAVLSNFYVFVSRLRKLARSGRYVFPLFVGMIAACMHNLTEYSMYRNNTLMWMMFLVCFVSVAVQHIVPNKPKVRRGPSKKNQSSSRRSRRSGSSSTKRYRW